MFRIRLEVDGKLIRNYDGRTYPTLAPGRLDWQGAKHIPFGRHTLTFLAYDRLRNVSAAQPHDHPPETEAEAPPPPAPLAAEP